MYKVKKILLQVYGNVRKDPNKLAEIFCPQFLNSQLYILCLIMSNNNTFHQITDISTRQFIRKLCCNFTHTSSACRAMQQLSHYLVTVPAGYAGRYLATFGSGQI